MAAQAQPVTDPTEAAKAMNLLGTRYPEYMSLPMPKPEEIAVYRVLPRGDFRPRLLERVWTGSGHGLSKTPPPRNFENGALHTRFSPGPALADLGLGNPATVLFVFSIGWAVTLLCHPCSAVAQSSRADYDKLGRSLPG